MEELRDFRKQKNYEIRFDSLNLVKKTIEHLELVLRKTTFKQKLLEDLKIAEVHLKNEVEGYEKSIRSN
jgi:hypothetical protein